MLLHNDTMKYCESMLKIWQLSSQREAHWSCDFLGLKIQAKVLVGREFESLHHFKIRWKHRPLDAKNITKNNEASHTKKYFK